MVEYIVRNHEYQNEEEDNNDESEEEDCSDDAANLDYHAMGPVPEYLDAKNVEELINFVKENPQAYDRLTDLMKTTGADLDQNLSIEQLRNMNQLIFKGFGDLWWLSCLDGFVVS